MGLAVAAERALALWRSLNPPVNPPLHELYTPILRHQELADRVAMNQAEINSRFQGMSDASAQSRRKIYESMDAIRKENSETRESLAGVKATLDASNKHTHELGQKLDILLTRHARQSS